MIITFLSRNEFVINIIIDDNMLSLKRYKLYVERGDMEKQLLIERSGYGQYTFRVCSFFLPLNEIFQKSLVADSLNLRQLSNFRLI